MNNGMQRKYGLFTAICMVVGIVIGSGVFFKAQTVLQKTGGDMTTGILAWLIGGAIMLVCLLSFAFMGQKYEKVNGVVDYAEATVGPHYGYLMGWFTTTIYYPAMTGVLAWVTARYTLVFLNGVGMPLNNPGADPILGSECMILALVFMAFSYAVNALSPKLAGKFQTSTTVIKLIPLGLMMVVGVAYGLIKGTLAENFQAVEAAQIAPAASPLFGAVCATAFAYEGWIIATSINSELKDSKKNLPKALVAGGIIIAAVYIFYFVGVAGGATTTQLMNDGAPVAFLNIFGSVFGNMLNLFIAISCFGTLNGLMLGTSRGMYSVAVRGRGPAPKMFSKVDENTDMPTNSSVVALLVVAAWLAYFYFANLWSVTLPDGTSVAWTGKPFAFDSSELPVITIYLMYIPIYLCWMIKEKSENALRRFIMPILAICGCTFMVVACVFSHQMSCFWYMVVFAIVMLIGWLVDAKNRKK